MWWSLIMGISIQWVRSNERSAAVKYNEGELATSRWHRSRNEQ